MNAYFCSVSGERIVAPGVSKSVDPEKGQDIYSEADAADAKPAKGKNQSAENADAKPAKG